MMNMDHEANMTGISSFSSNNIMDDQNKIGLEIKANTAADPTTITTTSDNHNVMCNACPYCDDICNNSNCQRCEINLENASKNRKRRREKCFFETSCGNNFYTMCQVRR